MHLQTGQLTLADTLIGEQLGRNAQLDRIAQVIDWQRVEDLFTTFHGHPTGRPAYPPGVMVRALLLAQWYNLSDPRLEEALSDSLSFRRFVGLGLEDPTPDHSTLCRFRQHLTESGLAQQLLAEVNRQLEGKGLILKQGTLLDATLVKAQAAKPSKREGLGALSPVDPDASWSAKHFGYKAHVGVDEGSGLIRSAILETARINESVVADALIQQDEQAIYADRAYESKLRRQWLKALGIKDRILHRSHKNQAKLPYWQQKRNQLVAPIRARVEKLFGTLKRLYGYRQVRYFGLRANQTQLSLLAIAFNLRRAVVLGA